MARLARAASSVLGSSSYIIVISFARGVVLARLLTPEEYGSAVILITMAAGLELIADGGVDQYLVRSRFGARADIIAVAQGYRFIAGLVAGCALIIGAMPLAGWLGAMHLWSAIALIAAPTILRGVTNLEIKVQQRNQAYDQEIKVDVLRYSAEFAALAVAAVLMRSYWAVVLGLFVNAITQVVTSSILCRRAARLSFEGRRTRLLGRFSWPIIVNSAILFAATQGDRLIISSALDLPSVARYATACAIGQAVMTLLSRVTSRILLPMFGESSIGQLRKRRQADQLTIAFIAGSAATALSLAFIVPPVLPLIYGPEFGGLHRIVFASACLQMLQIEQAWLTTLLTGAGATGRFPLITGVRALSLPAVLPLLSQSGNVLLVPYALTVGAAISLAISYATLAGSSILSRSSVAAGMARAMLTIIGMHLFLVQGP